MNRKLTLLSLATVAAWAVSAACSDNTGLAPPINENAIDTFTLSAGRDTNLAVPSGFSVSGTGSVPLIVNTQDNANFDFVFDFDDDSNAVFLTAEVLDVISTTSIRSGFQKSSLKFSEIETAPINNYITNDTMHLATSGDTAVVDVGQVWYIRSALVCSALSTPVYGKMEVLAIDKVARTLTFRVLVNENCGYHSLRVGAVTN